MTYNPTLTTAEQVRKAKFETWERVGNYWINKATGEKRMFHPMAEEIGYHLYKSARRLNGGKKLR